MRHSKTLLKAATLASMLCGATAWAANWKVAVGDGNSSAQEALGQKFAALVNAKSNGEHKLTLFLNGQLGSEQDTVMDVAIGTLDFSILASNNLAPFSPSVGTLSMPYLIRSLEEAEQIVSGPIGAQLTEDSIENAGVRILAWTFSGFRVLSNSKQPVKTLDDLKGMIIRVPKNEIMIDTYQAWGINPTPMAWTETFTALQQQVVDGQDTPYTTIHSMRFHEVQQYITDLRYLFLLEPLVMSEAIYQQQDKQTQQLLLEAGQEATRFSVRWLRDTEGRIRDELVNEHGMQISSPDNEANWQQQAIEQVWPEHYDSIGGKALLNRILSTTGRDEI